MKSEEIVNLKVVDIAGGNNVGTVTGMLIETEKKRVIALQIGGGFLSHCDYLPFESIKAIKNDVVMIPSASLVVGRGVFKDTGMLDRLIGRNVLTTDGKDIGTVHEYDINISTGMISSISVACDTAVMGGLWQNAGERFEVPRRQIVTLGDSIVVTKTVKLPAAPSG